jgi:hypothetical protein
MVEREPENNGTRDEDKVKVTDRRLFTADGDLRSDAVREREEPSAPADAQEAPPGPEPAAADPGFERRPVEEPQGVDFTMLINAMAEPALLFLGEIQHPGMDEPAVDLERARIQIDMLDLLRIKCRGNLTADEEGLLDRILYQLRMRYVSRASEPQT